jgi:outer membrane protein, heavy metal efflux system
MLVLHLLKISLPVLLLASSLAFAKSPPPIVEHEDPIEVDDKLTLSKVISDAMEKFPDSSWLKSLEDEAAAIAKRGKSWTAGAAQASLRFQEATSGSLHYVDAGVQVPLWNPGQRSAERAIAMQAESSGEAQAASVKLRVAGLVRSALWDIALQKIRHEQAAADLDITEQLYNKVQRRVELGDLPLADVLLAETERLQKLSTLTLAEAELMHARKRYTSITQSTKLPGKYNEELVALKEIQHNHPVLAAINSQIERKQAEIKAIKLVGSGQSTVAIGINSDHGSNDSRSNETESFNIGVNVPFGGEAHLAPQIAAAQVEMAKLMSEREQLFRDLEQAHHEAEHNLKVNAAEFDIAKQLQEVAEDHFKMMQFSFSAGEIDLMDLLKVQSRAQLAILSAKERAIIIERDKALYNQAVGVMP